MSELSNLKASSVANTNVLFVYIFKKILILLWAIFCQKDFQWMKSVHTGVLSE